MYKMHVIKHPVGTHNAHLAGTVASAEMVPCGAQRHTETRGSKHQCTLDARSAADTIALAEK